MLLASKRKGKANMLRALKYLELFFYPLLFADYYARFSAIVEDSLHALGIDVS
jgi:hypothetical protein